MRRTAEASSSERITGSEVCILDEGKAIDTIYITPLLLECRFLQMVWKMLDFFGEVYMVLDLAQKVPIGEDSLHLRLFQP